MYIIEIQVQVKVSRNKNFIGCVLKLGIHRSSFFTSDTDICDLVLANTDAIQKNSAELS